MIFAGLLTDRWSYPYLKSVVICHSDGTWHNYTLTKKIQKYINHVRHPLTYAGISIFYQKLSSFVMGNEDENCILRHDFLLFDF